MKTLFVIALSAFFLNATPTVPVTSAPAEDACHLVMYGTATMPDGSQLDITLEGEGADCEEAREGMKETIIRFKIRRKK